MRPGGVIEAAIQNPTPHFGAPTEDFREQFFYFDNLFGIHQEVNSRPMAVAGYMPFKGEKNEDVDGFLRKIELVALMHDRDDDYKIKLVSLLLEGPAEEWFLGYQSSLQGSCMQWNALKKALLHRFVSMLSPPIRGMATGISFVFTC